MSYVPPGVSTQALGPGTHVVCLTEIKEITDPAKLAKFNAQAVFVATYKSLEGCIEIDQVIKFTGSRADFYSGQTIDRLHLAAGLPEPAAGEPLDLDLLNQRLDGITLALEVNDKGYANAIQVPEPIGEDTI